jgi:hypothetical protein
VVFPGFKHYSLLAAAVVVVDLMLVAAVQEGSLKPLHLYLQVLLTQLLWAKVVKEQSMQALQQLRQPTETILLLFRLRQKVAVTEVPNMYPLIHITQQL